jgi:PKD repeat protein
MEDPGAVVFDRPGVYRVSFSVTDSSGVPDPTPDSRVITVACNSNLACNSSFEGSTTGWTPYGGATIERVSGGQEGAFALEVRGPATTTEFGINDSPNWVANTPAAGTRYRFSAWVRAAASSGRARLKVREYLNGVQAGGTTSSPLVPLTPDWQLLTVDHVTQAASSTLDFQVLETPSAPGQVFQVDTIAIRIVTGTTTNQPPNGLIDSPAGNVTILAGQSITFTGTGTDPDGNLPLTFLWTFGGGAPNSTAEDPGAVVFNTPGTYTVTFTVTDSLAAADPTPASRVITVTGSNQAPNGVIDAPATNVTIMAGQSVSFAGIGTDPDGHLPLTFLWTFGGGAPNATVEDPGVVTFSTPGTYTVTFTVTDSLGLADPTPDSRVIVVADPSGPSNFVRNPSFESDTSGWAAYGSSSTTIPTIQRVAGGQDGAFALEVRGPGSMTMFGINDSPNWVGSTGGAGTRYRFTAWVRAETSTGQALLRIREYNSGVQIGPTVRSAPVVLSPAWQMLTVDFIAGAAGSSLDFQVLDYVPVTAGEVFQVDNIGIRVVP